MKENMITHGNWENFLTLEGEELLLVKRRHPFVVAFPLFILVLLTTIFFAAAFLLFIVITFSVQLFIISTLLIISLISTFLTKCIVDWHFHFYLLTTRKMLEVWYTPLYSYVVNDVLLDSVNCTQIDFRRNGIVQEILDIGDIVITFDRPTHQDEFVLKDVQECYRLGRFLTQKLLDKSEFHRSNNVDTIWFKQREKKGI